MIGTRVLTISVSRTVDVTIVAAVTLVLDVRRVNGDTTGLLLRRLVNLGVVGEARSALLREDLGDGRRQGGLSMINVT